MYLPEKNCLQSVSTEDRCKNIPGTAKDRMNSYAHTVF